MTTLVIVSLALSLTQLITIGWLARRSTRANRNIDSLTTQCVGYTAALECHERRLDGIADQCDDYSAALECYERRLDVLAANHNQHRSQRDIEWNKMQLLDEAMRDQRQSIRALELLVDDLCNDIEEIDSELDATIDEVAAQDSITERRFEGVNGDLDTLFDDVLVQKGGGL
jgi:chromosome segregation ATPase